MHHVVVGALIREGRVLLVHRHPQRAAYPNAWDLPGGHVEAGETETDALARELHEELGVRISPDSVSWLGELRAGTPADPVQLTGWVVNGWSDEPRNLDPDEHDDIGWFGVEGLPVLAHPSLRADLVGVMRDGAVTPPQASRRRPSTPQ